MYQLPMEGFIPPECLQVIFIIICDWVGDHGSGNYGRGPRVRKKQLLRVTDGRGPRVGAGDPGLGTKGLDQTVVAGD